MSVIDTVWPACALELSSPLVWTPPYKTKPRAWVSRDGVEYPYGNYSNHGYGGIKVHQYRDKDGTMVYKEYLDLPADGYPYTLVYEDPVPPAWLGTSSTNNI